jgi:hypothetical protein
MALYIYARSHRNAVPMRMKVIVSQTIGCSLGIVSGGARAFGILLSLADSTDMKVNSNGSLNTYKSRSCSGSSLLTWPEFIDVNVKRMEPGPVSSTVSRSEKRAFRLLEVVNLPLLRESFTLT